MNDPYAALAAYYDLLIPDWEAAVRNAGEQLDRILRPLGVTSVLDCTCGTGIHSIGLAQKGYSVTGSDVSRPMLRKARQNAQRTGVAVRWLHADIRSLRAAVKDCFDAVITCGSSLLHLVSPRDLSEALESMFAVTREGGYILTVVASSEKSLKKIYPFMYKQIQLPDGVEVSFFTTTEYGEEAIFLNLFIVRTVSGNPKVTHIPMRLRLVGQQELQDLLIKVGFVHVKSLSNSGTLTLLAEKT